LLFKRFKNKVWGVGRRRGCICCGAPGPKLNQAYRIFSNRQTITNLQTLQLQSLQNLSKIDQAVKLFAFRIMLTDQLVLWLNNPKTEKNRIAIRQIWQPGHPNAGWRLVASLMTTFDPFMYNSCD